MLGFVLACASAPGEDSAGPARPDLTDEERATLAELSPLDALPADPTNAVADDDAAAALGQALFFDTALSANGAVACATCHAPATGFADGLPLAKGVGQAGKHSPTVLDSARNRWFFWDGRADTAWTQATGPWENPVEHGGTRLGVAHHLADEPALRASYEAVFGALPDLADGTRFPARARPVPDDVLDPDNVAWEAMAPEDQTAATTVFVNAAKAVAAYERHLVTGPSRFDAFVAGDDTALTDAEVRGLDLVLRSNCTLCHSAGELTDREFHNLALPVPDYAPQDPDYGRYAGIVKLRANPLSGAGAWSDDPEAGAAKSAYLALTDEQIGQFKTPSLRNVGRTAPYMHDGQFATLEDVITFYSTLPDPEGEGHREEFLRPLDLSDAEIADLAAFLRSLDGELPDDRWLAAP